ncbi:XRE family transcriptional regulator [Streptomyces kronopolitis]|uniref:XRE family transcriptional regulator n=1 Tax=Streptomyces kronopolitis TaxID=1612435 RepID=UPI0020BFF4EA|nr:XRE family transcriptional regulator [Streptomyces kronopolitis]MCL6302850.1 XRE family transcriptional regulator [Streptomyces kronopolitis]
MAAEAPRTDLSDLVRKRRAQLRLSLRALASRCVDPKEPDAGSKWTFATLGNLETKTIKAPGVPELRALAAGLDLPLRLLQEAAGAQYLGIDTVWSDDRETRTMVHGYWELDPEDRAKIRAMIESWGSGSKRDDTP